MAITTDQIFKHLKRIHLFRSLKDEQVRVIAALFEAGKWDENKTVIQQGAEPGNFYIIYRGAVEMLLREQVEPDVYEEQHLAHLSDFDYFGEQSLLNSELANAVVRTTQKTALFYLPRNAFEQMLEDYPAVGDALQLANQTRHLMRTRRYERWLTDEETVYLISRKHLLWLAARIWLPAAIALFLLLAIYGVWFFFGIFWWPTLLILALPGLWAGLHFIDWRDDTYMVTNKRVVSDERLALLYMTRTEAPLWTVRSVQVSQSTIGRMAGYGNLTIQTITGSVTFHDVTDPFLVSRLIAEHSERTRVAKRQADEETLRRDIRQSIGWEAPADQKEIDIKPFVPERRGLARFFQFRTQEGDTVIWHKHPVVMLRQTMIPTIILLVLAGLMVMRLREWPAILAPLWEFEAFPLLFWAVGLGFFALIALVWWIYKYNDWANDTYAVDSKQIIDSERKPWLGDVEQRAALIDNVLNVKYERPGPLAIIFNYGNVIIQTGGETGELTFIGVYNPLEIQQEIFRRMELSQRRKADAEAQRRREEIVQWLRAYAQVTQPNRPERPWGDFPEDI